MTRHNKILGNTGEYIACLFLESKGYKIVARNYRAYRREIDIIAEKGEYIVFAEVKTRSAGNFGTPSEGVNTEKRKHIIFAAKNFLMENASPYYGFQPRFDVIEVYIDGKSGKNYVRHIESAFMT